MHPWRPDLEHLSPTEIYELLDDHTKKGVDRIVWEKTKKLPELDIVVDDRYQLKKWDLLWLLDPKPELFHPEYNNLTDEEKAIFLCGYDPALWVRTFLKYEPRIYQLLFLRVSTKSTRLALRWGRRCMTGDTPILLSNGMWKRLEDIIPGDKVVSFENNDFAENEVTDFYNNGKQEVYKVSLSNGLDLTVTGNHPLLVQEPEMVDDNGYTRYYDNKSKIFDWKTIQNGLRPGLRVAQINDYKVFGNVKDHNSAIFLGYMLTDGYFGVVGQTPKFTNNNVSMIEEIKDISNNLFGYDCPIRTKNNGFDIHITGGVKGKKNLANQFLEKCMGTGNKGARLQKVPDIVYSLDEESTSLFINRLFSGDGGASIWENGDNRTATELFLSFPSESFLDEIRLILLKYGITAKIGKDKDIFKLRINSQESILNFFQTIGYIFGKETKCRLLEEKINAKRCNRTIVHENISLPRIKSIELVGEEETFDITVENTHNFIANGIVSHNSGKSFAMIWKVLHYALSNPGSRVILITPYECLDGDSEIMLQDGSISKIKDLVGKDKAFINSMDDSFKIVPSIGVKAVKNKIKDIYKVKTNSGKELLLSENHPLFTGNGWKELKDICVGDLIATPRILPYKNSVSTPLHISRILGYYVAEGCIGDARICNTEMDILSEYGDCCLQVDNELVLKYETKTIRPARDRGKFKVKQSKINSLLKEYGLWGKTAHNKTVPEQIFSSQLESIAEFLGAAYSGDGHINVEKTLVQYSTVNKKLASQISHLLLRFGIISFVKEITYKTGDYIGQKQYTVSIWNSESIKLFHDNIRLTGKKKLSLEQLNTKLLNTNSKNYTDVIPEDIILDHITNIKKIRNMLLPELTNGNIKVLPIKGQNPTRIRMKNISDSFVTKDKFTEDISYSDIYWDKVISIEFEKTDYTYDLEVKEHHNFIANDIIVHNSQINMVYADLWTALAHSGIKETDDIKEAFLIERALRKPIEIYFKNGSIIRMFTSGARSGGNADTIRGQEADLLILDELAYFGDNDLSAITPMLQDTSDEKTYEKILLACSTPAGRSDPFYQLVDPDNPKSRMKEYWFSVFANPLFNSLSEQAAREETKTRANFEREYIADWGDMSVGVFRPQILELSSRPYAYSKTKLSDGDHVILGMDWDKYGAGVNLCIIEQLGVWAGDDVGKYKIIQRYELERGSVKDLLGAGVREAVILDNKYNFDFVYIDRGYGERQWEELVEVLGNKVVGVNYSSAVDELDPVLGTITKEPLKAFCVDNAVSIFERLNLIVNSNDEVLRGQMIAYSRLKTSMTGRPVFGSTNPVLYPDHAVDALCYALLGFKQQFGDLIPRAKFMVPVALNVKSLTLDPSLDSNGEIFDKQHDRGRSRDFTIRTESSVWGTGKRRARTYKRGNW